MALLAVLKKGRASLRMALAFEEFLAVQKQLREIFHGMGVALKPAALAIPPVPAPEPPVEKPAPAEPEPGLDELEDVIQKSGAELKPEEVEAFWESVPDAGKIAPDSPDVITYDQASRLGLAPKEKE